MSKLREFFTGVLVPTEQTWAAPPPMSPAEWRVRFRQALQDEKAACLHWEQVARRVAELREMGMARADLRREMAEADAAADPTPMPQRTVEETVRVKILTGFSTEWNGLPLNAPENSVVDLPKSFVRAAAHICEILTDQTTPLHRVQPSAEIRR